MGYNELLLKVRKEELMSAYVILVRLCLAILFAGVIGYDRQRKNRPAGLRTHILVCIGATAISMIQSAVFYQKMNGFPEIEVDQVRLLAPIVSGILGRRDHCGYQAKGSRPDHGCFPLDDSGVGDCSRYGLL